MMNTCDHTWWEKGYEHTRVQGKCPVCKKIVRPVRYYWRRFVNSRVAHFIHKTYWIYLIAIFTWVLARDVWFADYVGAIGNAAVIILVLWLDRETVFRLFPKLTRKRGK